MAKKKSAAAAQNGVAAAPPEPAEQQIEQLRALNKLLAHQAFENREHVKLLETKICEIGDENEFVAGVGSEIFGLLVSSRLAEIAGLSNFDDGEMEERFRVLNERLGLVSQQRDDFEKSYKSVVEERDAVKKSLESVVEEKEKVEKSLESVVEERDRVEKLYKSVVEEGDEVKKSLKLAVDKRDRLEKSLRLVVEERDEVKKSLELVIRERDEVKNSLAMVVEEKNEVKKSLELVVEEKGKVEKSLGLVVDEKNKVEKSLQLVVEEKDAVKKSLELAFVERDEIKKSLGAVVKERDDLKTSLKFAVDEMNEAKKSRDLAVEERDAVKKSLELALKEKDKVEKSLGVVVEERDEVKKSLALVVEERDKVKRSLGLALEEREEDKKSLNLAVDERNEVKKSLKLALEERDEMKKLLGLAVEERDSAVGDLDRLKRQLEAQRVAAEKEVGQLKDEKGAVEESVREMGEILKRMEERLAWADAEKCEVEGILARVMAEKVMIKSDVEFATATMLTAQREAEILQGRVKGLEEEKVVMRLELEKEKEGFLKEIEALKIEHKAAIDDLKNHIEMLQKEVSQLDLLCKTSAEKNTLLLADMESAKKDIDSYKKEASELELQVLELTRKKNTADEEVLKIKGAYETLLKGHENVKKLCDSLTLEKSSLEKNLRSTQSALKETEQKMIAADKNSRKAMFMLSNISDTIHSLLEGKEKCIEDDSSHEIELDEATLKIDKTLEAVKGHVSKIKDLKRELDLSQIAVETHKKNNPGVWKWIYPAASSVVAAISVAYAANHR